MQLANNASYLALALAVNLAPLSTWSLPAPKKQDGDGHNANLRLQNDSPQFIQYNYDPCVHLVSGHSNYEGSKTGSQLMLYKE